MKLDPYLEFQKDTGDGTIKARIENMKTHTTEQAILAYIMWLEVFWLDHQIIRIAGDGEPIFYKRDGKN